MRPEIIKQGRAMAAELKALIVSGGGDGEEADEVRERLDVLWNSLSPEEEQELRLLPPGDPGRLAPLHPDCR